MRLQETSLRVWEMKYKVGENEEVEDSFKRTAWFLSQQEKDPAYWEEKFLEVMLEGAIPGGRIMANAGTGNKKLGTTLVNCVVSAPIEDSMEGILDRLHDAGVTLAKGAGIGYEFSSLRPYGAHVSGVGAETSGPLGFMHVYDSLCASVASAGGRRGAQMATFDISHPDIYDLLKEKRKPGSLRKFNISVLVTDDFLQKVKSDGDWDLIFPIRKSDPCVDDSSVLKVWRSRRSDQSDPAYIYGGPDNENILCKIYRTVKARDLWSVLTESTYALSDPGVLFIDSIN